jgi:hypothetical protein
MKTLTRELEVIRWGSKGTIGRIEMSAELYQSMAKNHNELRLFGQHVHNGSGVPNPGPQMLILWAQEVTQPGPALPNVDGWI